MIAYKNQVAVVYTVGNFDLTNLYITKSLV